MTQRKLLFDDESVGNAVKRSGPPNNMNDMRYGDWMKFQKSFFRFRGLGPLVSECVQFFSKSTWPDGRGSSSLVVGVAKHDLPGVDSPRKLESIKGKSVPGILVELRKAAKHGKKYDFILFDLRSILNDIEQVEDFLQTQCDDFYRAVRNLLYDARYACVLVDDAVDGKGPFPVAWAIALAGRAHLRLRDEKIALDESSGSAFYCLYFQAENDGRKKFLMLPSELHTKAPGQNIPSWIIPRPPPRKKNEILHPAKFPETLISEFIQLFTKEGDIVFDPMVGTGSTVLAAIQLNREGYGVDLNDAFVEIARARVAVPAQQVLFADTKKRGGAVISQGDATDLDAVAALDGVSFNYVVTSPPYWSMLANPGSENQRSRRQKNLRLVYSDASSDVGNEQDYDKFLALLENIYLSVSRKLVKRGVLTVIVKNVKREHVVYPLAWDLTARLCGRNAPYDFIGSTFWCQDDVSLKPFAVGAHWVSNTLHQYCLHFRKR